ncbi:molybdenum cofactor biosynthesis prote [Annulohypoxylon maeteangense]|uniref:molybdenum cofactor biosynthesis prote n=1 Tax=Annulohypoxylon maeteangense TaxID=1927788 RepID=UPI002007FC1A|nr:molybdenum cofactor biosynthesis prote [Annulohypoxylon maeteangense]KAI0887287.1 molybdenum cofactor biosynthesis prote [Annulohypoxylon maeteangense]
MTHITFSMNLVRAVSWGLRTPTGKYRSESLRRIGTAAAAVAIPNISESESPIQAPPAQPSRRQLLKDAKPFSDFLTDTFQRQHDYLRISLTERCNLRCVYCMPEEGVPLSPQRELLTTPEVVMLSSLFVSQGVNKIRLTGGEPTIRKDILPLMQQIGALRPHGLRELCLTTNGIALHRKLEGMVEAGLTGVNLSLDTLDPWQFQIMTRRKGFDAVMKSIERVFELNKHGAGIKLKINAVVMRGINDREIIPFVEMTREKDIEVRFIEYMPFDGNKWNEGKMFSYSEMLDRIREKFPGIEKVRDHKNDTSKTYRIPGFVGKIGFITSMTHNFCGSCNRLRITSDGNLKVCLFGNSEVSLRDILRESNGGEPVDEEAYETMKKIEMDRRQQISSEPTSLHLSPSEHRLLEVIGMAVKRKKAKHAGIGELEHMKNRPMILIGPRRFIPDSRSQILPFDAARNPLVIPSAPKRVASWLPTPPNIIVHGQHLRCFSQTSLRHNEKSNVAKLTHVSESGSAHMVSISEKTPTKRIAKAACSIHFTNRIACKLIKENQIKKGDVLGVARVAGIMAAKRTSDLIPLCHPIAITKVTVDLVVRENDNNDEEENGGGRVDIEATVACDGKTGVEMEALTAASTAALTVYDMCKAVDKRMSIQGLRVVLKEGGKSGRWVDGVQDDLTSPDE